MSKEYVIMTDSSCDLPQELADQLGLEVLPLEVMADGKNYRNWLDGREIGFKEFYKLAREGKDLKTSAVNTAAFDTVSVSPFTVFAAVQSGFMLVSTSITASKKIVILLIRF